MQVKKNINLLKLLNNIIKNIKVFILFKKIEHNQKMSEINKVLKDRNDEL